MQSSTHGLNIRSGRIRSGCGSILRDNLSCGNQEKPYLTYQTTRCRDLPLRDLPAQLLSGPKVHFHTATQGLPIASSGLLRAKQQHAEPATNPDLAQSWQQLLRFPWCIRATRSKKDLPVKIAICDLDPPLASAASTAAFALPAN